MKQDEVVLLLFKVVLIADLVTLAAFVADYSWRAKWWSNAIGRTLVIKDLLLGAAITPSVLSLFFHFTRLSSRIAAWVDITLFAAIAVVMTWRVAVFERIHREKSGTLTPPGPDGKEEP